MGMRPHLLCPAAPVDAEHRSSGVDEAHSSVQPRSQAVSECLNRRALTIEHTVFDGLRGSEREHRPRGEVLAEVFTVGAVHELSHGGVAIGRGQGQPSQHAAIPSAH